MLCIYLYCQYFDEHSKDFWRLYISKKEEEKIVVLFIMQIICKCVEIPKYDLELFHTYLKKKKTYILFCLTVFPTFLQKKELTMMMLYWVKKKKVPILVPTLNYTNSL